MVTKEIFSALYTATHPCLYLPNIEIQLFSNWFTQGFSIGAVWMPLSIYWDYRRLKLKVRYPIKIMMSSAIYILLIKRCHIYPFVFYVNKQTPVGIRLDEQELNCIFSKLAHLTCTKINLEVCKTLIDILKKYLSTFFAFISQFPEM